MVEWVVGNETCYYSTYYLLNHGLNAKNNQCTLLGQNTENCLAYSPILQFLLIRAKRVFCNCQISLLEVVFSNSVERKELRNLFLLNKKFQKSLPHLTYTFLLFLMRKSSNINIFANFIYIIEHIFNVSPTIILRVSTSLESRAKFQFQLHANTGQAEFPVVINFLLSLFQSTSGGRRHCVENM